MNLNLKWAVLGAVLGFSAASGLACGPANKCTPSTCPFGCCDASGTCQQGSSDSLCGSQASVCQACTFGQVCVVGRCVASGSGTGGSSGSGGGTSNTGGGTGTGGGSGTGGGTSAGGGTGTGGGASMGGGTGTGGGTSTGGGTGTGGGSGSDVCSRLVGAVTQWYAGRTVCESSSGNVTQDPSALSKCQAGVSACASSSDQAVLNQWVTCIGGAPRCTTGSESAAVQGFTNCALQAANGLSTSCRNALTSSSTGGGGGTATGGGGGTATGGGGGTAAGGGGGSTAGCTVMSPVNTTRGGGTLNGTATTTGFGATTSGNPTDLINVEVWWSTGISSVPYTEDLALEPTYGGCPTCLVLKRACDFNVQMCTGGDYLGISGSVTVTQATRGDAGVFQASWQNVRFQEWDFVSDTAVDGGRCLTTASGSLNVFVQ